MAETAQLPLDPRAVRLAAVAVSRDDAIRQCGQALVDVGAVEESYIGAMLERECSISTYVGEGNAATRKDSGRRLTLGKVQANY
jgi:PTS system mannitol-specific IIA component